MEERHRAIHPSNAGRILRIFSGVSDLTPFLFIVASFEQPTCPRLSGLLHPLARANHIALKMLQTLMRWQPTLWLVCTHSIARTSSEQTMASSIVPRGGRLLTTTRRFCGGS